MIAFASIIGICILSSLNVSFPFAGPIANGSVFFLANILAMSIFPIATAIAAMMVGFIVTKLYFGLGETVAHAKIFGVDIIVGNAFGGSDTFYAVDSLRAIRIRQTLVRLAGPIASLGAAVLFYYASGLAPGDRQFNSFSLSSALFVAAIANAWYGFSSLMPFKLPFAYGSTTSPGSHIAQLLTRGLSDMEKEALLIDSYVRQYSVAAQERQIEKASALVQEAVRLYPFAEQIKNIAGCHASQLGNHNQALQIFEALTQLQDISARARMMYFSNFAYAAVMANDKNAIQGAISNIDYIRGQAELSLTDRQPLGLLLVYSGNSEEGISILTKDFNSARTWHDSAERAAALAMCFLHLGEQTKASQFLQIAKDADKSGHILSEFNLQNEVPTQS